MAVHGRSQPVPAVISRGSLADAPVLTTPAPVVQQAAPTPGFGQPQAPLVSSAPFIAGAVPAQPPPAPVVVMATAVTPWGRPQAAVIAASPAAPPAAAVVTPQPVVVAQAVKIAAAQPPVILRNALLPDPNAFTVGTLTAFTGFPGALTALTALFGALTASDAPGIAADLGLFDESGMSVLDEAGGFLLLENGT